MNKSPCSHITQKCKIPKNIPQDIFEDISRNKNFCENEDICNVHRWENSLWFNNKVIPAETWLPVRTILLWSTPSCESTASSRGQRRSDSDDRRISHSAELEAVLVKYGNYLAFYLIRDKGNVEIFWSVSAS